MGNGLNDALHASLLVFLKKQEIARSADGGQLRHSGQWASLVKHESLTPPSGTKGQDDVTEQGQSN